MARKTYYDQIDEDTSSRKLRPTHYDQIGYAESMREASKDSAPAKAKSASGSAATSTPKNLKETPPHGKAGKDTGSKAPPKMGRTETTGTIAGSKPAAAKHKSLSGRRRQSEKRRLEALKATAKGGGKGMSTESDTSEKSVAADSKKPETLDVKGRSTSESKSAAATAPAKKKSRVRRIASAVGRGIGRGARAAGRAIRTSLTDSRQTSKASNKQYQKREANQGKKVWT